MKFIDNYLNRITMYRLLIYGLAILLAVAVGGAFAGKVSFSPYGLMLSAAILIVTCYVTNRIFALFYGACSSFESSIITALILFFIFSPPQNAAEAGVLALAASIAMASKYLLAYRERLLFNPAAIAAVIISLSGLGSATWWVASQFMTVFTVLLGILIIRKVRRAHLFFIFLASALSIILIKNLSVGIDMSLLKSITFSWPFVFLGTVMLTEPMTMPARKKHQLLYGLVVGCIFASSLHVGRVFSTPEVALVVGNIFAFFTLTQQRVRLKLVGIQQFQDSVYEFSFEPAAPFTYRPGQYIDLTMPHTGVDKRGSRRSFTFASSPSEKQVLFAMKCPQPSSSFKKALMSLQPGGYVYGSQIAGDFILPKNTQQKLLFIAGGIGITPYRSMVKTLLELKQNRDIVLLYVSSDPHGYTYDEVFREAASLGLKVIYILSAPTIPNNWNWEVGHIDKKMLDRLITDISDRVCFLSGPNTMVNETKKQLLKTGVKRRNIKTDYFSGY